jgi:hypothetical protein
MGTSLLDSLAGRRFVDFFGYQLGLEGRSPRDIVTGDMNEKRALGGMEYRRAKQDDDSRFSKDVRTSGRDYSISTSFKIPDPVDVSFNTVKLGWGDDYTHRPDMEAYDSSRIWPDITVGASSGILETIGIVKTYMQQLNLNSQYTYTHSTSKAGRTPGEDEKWKQAWQPLVRLNGSLKKPPIRVNYQHNFSTEKQKGTSDKWSKTSTHSDNASVNYEIKQSTKEREIKIFKWAIPVKGKTDVGVTLEHSHTVRFENVDLAEGEKEPAFGEDEEHANDRSLSLTPEISYVFTDNVTGTARYSGRREIDKVGEIKTMSHLIEMIVNIRF